MVTRLVSDIMSYDKLLSPSSDVSLSKSSNSSIATLTGNSSAKSWIRSAESKDFDAELNVLILYPF